MDTLFQPLHVSSLVTMIFKRKALFRRFITSPIQKWHLYVSSDIPRRRSQWEGACKGMTPVCV